MFSFGTQQLTRYFNSQFLGKAAAANILKSFKSSMNGLDKEKLPQVSMDGPNVNTKFLSNLNEERWDQESSQLISIETCEMHTVQNVFKNGENASGWKFKMLLSSMFKIFYESPSQWADYEILTEAFESDYPLKFFSHWWVENEDVAKFANAV